LPTPVYYLQLYLQGTSPRVKVFALNKYLLLKYPRRRKKWCSFNKGRRNVKEIISKYCANRNPFTL